MRPRLAALTFAALVLGAGAAAAEKRIFIVANNADGYGVDRCLASGATCGAAAAAAYCRGHEFAQALSYRKVEREDITGAVSAIGSSCRGLSCEEFVAIECGR
jgi:hypothetical protein